MTNAVLQGKLYAGNPHVQFDEGEDAPAATPKRFACACAKIASAGIAVLLCGAAMGADYHWTGAAGDHLWSTAGNWTDSSGNAVAAPTPDTAYTYNFTQSAFADKAFSLVVTQDINVVFGTAVAVHGAGSSAETTDVTFVSAKGCKLSMPAGITFYLRSNSRLTLETDMSADKSSKDINKSGEGELVFNLKAPNAALRNVRIKGGLYRIAATGAQPLIRVAFDTSATESNGGVFENDKSGMTLGGIFIGALSASWQSIGRVDMNGTMLNVGDASNTTSTNFLPMPVFADGGKLTLQNERRMYLEGLPLGGTLAVDRADAQVVARRTAVRWLFEDAGNPLKDTVGAGERVLAPAGMPEVVEDSVRGKVLSISGGKYLKGPDADAGFAELQPQPTNNPYTVAFWFKPNSGCDDKGKIFYWGENANGKSAALRLNNDAANGLMFTVWGDNHMFATAASPRDGKWHHFAVTYNGLKTFRIYYDGKQVDTFTSDIYYPPNRNFYVGSIHGGWVSDGANPYTGLLDDFLIGSYELPAESIKKLLDVGLAATISASSVEAKSAGEVAFAKKNANLARLSGNALAGGVTLQAEGTTLTVGADGTVGDDLFKGKIGGADATLVKEGADYALELSGPAAAVTNVTVKEGTLTLRRPLAAESLLPEPSAHWTFDDEANPGADSSANGLTLTKSSGEVTLVEGEAICGKAARFSSASGFFKLDEFPSAIPSSSNAVTFIVRYRPDKTQNGTYYPGIVMWGDTAGWNVGKLVKISTEKETPASIRLTIGGQNYAPGGFYRTDMGTERSRWITMAFVCSPKIDEAGKSCVKLYVDGEYVEQRDSVVNVTAKEFSIGSNYAGTQNFYGLIDDVQIYGSALSSGQIRLIAEQLEASKGVAGGASAPASTLLREPPVAVASGATLRVASAERFAALSGAGTVEVSSLASLTVGDMRGFSGSLTGHGTVTVEKGWTLDRSRVSVAPTLKVHAPGSGMRIIIR